MAWLRTTLAALCVGSAVHATVPVSTTAEALSQRWMTAYNSGNIEALVAVYAADARVQHGYCMAVNGREQIADFWGKDFEEGLETKLMIVDSFEVAEVVYVSGHYAVVQTDEPAASEGPLGGSFTQIWRRTDAAEWRLYRESWINLACVRVDEEKPVDEHAHGIPL